MPSLNAPIPFRVIPGRGRQTRVSPLVAEFLENLELIYRHDRELAQGIIVCVVRNARKHRGQPHQADSRSIGWEERLAARLREEDRISDAH